MTDEQDLRHRLSSVLDGISDDTLREVVGGIFSLEKLTTAQCPNCGKKAKVLTPDFRGFAAGLAALADQGKGKAAVAAPPPPREASQEELQEAIRRELEGLSDARLSEVAR